METGASIMFMLRKERSSACADDISGPERPKIPHDHGFCVTATLPHFSLCLPCFSFTFFDDCRILSVTLWRQDRGQLFRTWAHGTNIIAIGNLKPVNSVPPI